MRTLLVTALLLATVAGACSRKGGQGGEPAGSAPPLRWHTYYDMALREAARDGRKVLVAFYARDCPLCKAMDDSTYADARVRRLLKDMVTIRLSVEADSLTRDSLRVSEHPAAIILRSDGTEIDRVVGFYSPGPFVTRVQNILAGRRTFDDLLTHEQEHLSDTPYLFELAQKFIQRGNPSEALARLALITEKDPRNALGVTDKAYFLWGRILRDQERFEDSIVPLTMLIERFPQSDLKPEARALRASALLCVKGRGQEGVKELEALRKDFPGTAVGTWADEELEKVRAAMASRQGRTS